MLREISQQHWNDANGRPAGGSSYGCGFAISWQNGPIRAFEGEPSANKPNGAFVEDVLAAVIGRMEFYQASEFACTENAYALESLKRAADWLDRRTKDRQTRGVEGTYAV